MRIRLLLSVIATAALTPLATYAHDCSGGTDGGMDATGNQCNGWPVVRADSENRKTPTQRSASKPDAKKKAASCVKCATKGREATRNGSLHQGRNQG